MSATSLTEILLTHWQSLTHIEPISVTGCSLTIADVVRLSRHLAPVELSSEAIDNISKSSNVINEKLAQGDVIYGINTGFGGSADTRTHAVVHLQQSLLHHLMCGVVLDGKPKSASQYRDDKLDRNGHINGGANGTSRPLSQTTLPLSDPLASASMPESWVRATILIRLNSLAGGASGIRVCIAESLAELLNKDITPLIPLRGSISASGDLSPLSWVGALMQGMASAKAFVGSRLIEGGRKLVRADEALAEKGVEPILFHAKEGLAIVNGTAVSAGVAALAAHEALNLAALSQLLTAMSVEALRGTDESFEPFIAKMRPHPGQIDSAANIFALLRDSKLVTRTDKHHVGTLRQDRYSTRTASQWIGPVLEDFKLAYQQITIELNSVTDNPLIDLDHNRILHGGNFQAKAITSAVEKLRQGLQSIGRMLFSQCTELINPATSNGLPGNLISDAPADSYLFKGLDVVVAGLTSELGFLANPVGSHVQTAEMGNQGINSLALISARYTLEAVDVLSQLCSSHLMCLCQALDLRAMVLREDKNNLRPDAGPLLGRGTRRMYQFIREDLGVPFLGEAQLVGTPDTVVNGSAPSISMYNTAIYEAIRSGRLYGVVMDCLKEAVA